MRLFCVKQKEENDCALACLATIARYYGKKISINNLAQYTTKINSELNIYELCNIADEIGFEATAYQCMEDFNEKDLKLPCVAFVYNSNGKGHYIVIFKIEKEWLIIGDPAIGKKKVSRKSFWSSSMDESSPYIWEKILVLFEKNKKFSKHNNKDKNIFYDFFKLNKFDIIMLAIMTLLVSCLSIYFAEYFGMIIDEYIPYKMVQALVMTTIYLGILILGTSLLNWWVTYKAVKLGCKFHMQLSNQYNKHLVRLSYESFQYRKNGDYISRFQDISDIEQAYISAILTIPTNCVLILFFSIAILKKNRLLFLVAFAISIAYCSCYIIYMKNIEIKNRENMIEISELMSSMIELTDGFQTVKKTVLENTMFEKTRRKVNKCQEKRFNLGQVLNNQGLIKSIINGIGSLLVIFVGAIEIIKGNLSIGELITYNMLISYMLKPIKELLSLQPILQTAQVAYERIQAIFLTKAEENKSVESKISDIDINNVSFSFDQRKSVLTNINLKIKLGEKISIVGECGSGKSTLAKLLVKLYSVNDGKILIDGIDINSIGNDLIRNKIVLISQDDFIFSQSVKENLLLSDEKMITEEVQNILNITGVNKIISGLPNGFDTVIGAGGVELSKGQAQMIAIARMLIKKPNVIILDEATSNIDMYTEQQIVNYLIDRKEITLIIISHKANVICKSDMVYFLDDGRIIAQGCHQELLKNCKKYKDCFGGGLYE